MEGLVSMPTLPVFDFQAGDGSFLLEGLLASNASNGYSFFGKPMNLWLYLAVEYEHVTGFVRKRAGSWDDRNLRVEAHGCSTATMENYYLKLARWRGQLTSDFVLAALLAATKHGCTDESVEQEAEFHAA
jgi:hypothetical protein